MLWSLVYFSVSRNFCCFMYSYYSLLSLGNSQQQQQQKRISQVIWRENHDRIKMEGLFDLFFYSCWLLFSNKFNAVFTEKRIFLHSKYLLTLNNPQRFDKLKKIHLSTLSLTMCNWKHYKARKLIYFFTISIKMSHITRYANVLLQMITDASEDYSFHIFLMQKEKNWLRI